MSRQKNSILINKHALNHETFPFSLNGEFLFYNTAPSISINSFLKLSSFQLRKNTWMNEWLNEEWMKELNKWINEWKDEWGKKE